MFVVSRALSFSENAKAQESALREAWGTIGSATGIVVNLLLAAIKFIVGVLSGSSRFGELMAATCLQYGRELLLQKPCQFTPNLDVAAYLQNTDVVLVPSDYEKYCNSETAKKLKNANLILCHYELDDGSSLHLEEKLQQLREEKIK